MGGGVKNSTRAASQFTFASRSTSCTNHEGCNLQKTLLIEKNLHTRLGNSCHGLPTSQVELVIEIKSAAPF